MNTQPFPENYEGSILNPLVRKYGLEKMRILQGDAPLCHGSVDAPRVPQPASSAGTHRTGRGAGEPAQTPAWKTSPVGDREITD